MPPRPRPEVLFHDAHTLLVNKPPGMVVENPSVPHAPSLKGMVRAAFPEARPVHRIDKDTSGLVLWALSEAAYRHYSALFRQRQVEKEYHAIVCGVMPPEKRTVTLPVFRGSSGKARISHRHGRAARTELAPIEAFRNFTLVACRPRTGRYHQIRVHLAAIGFPIAGDPIYGGCLPLLSRIKRHYKAKRDREEAPLIRRTALHARELRLVLYGHSEKTAWEAPYPGDFRSLLQKLRKYDRLSNLLR